MELELIERLAVATGIGLLVGIERGWRERTAQAGSRTAGVRTFTLTGLLGGVCGALARALNDAVGGSMVIGFGLLVFGAAFTLFKFRESQKDHDFSVTTVVAALATFALGSYALLGSLMVAAGAGVAMTVILAARESLHGWLERVTWTELRAGLVLATMTFLALPIIPDQSYGPFGGINPRQIWLLAVVLAGVSFLGYATAKTIGARRGLLAAAAAGGLVSSTAVTLTAARRAAAGEADTRLLAASAALAGGVSIARTLALIAVLNYEVALYAAAPLVVAVVATLGMTWVLGRSDLGAASAASFELKNPFSLRETIMLALLLAGVLLSTRVAATAFGPTGALVAAVIAGAADTDSPTYTMSELARGAIAPWVAGLGVMLAVAANNVFKFVTSAALGGREFASALALGIGIPVAAAALAALIILTVIAQ
jgi:uncharacterized membrane protein (DUF4010 family)